MLLIRSLSWNKMSILALVTALQCVSKCVCVERSEGCTIWLEGREGRFCIISSISSNFLAMAWISECSSLYSAYWSLNTALYWSLSSSERMLGYFLWKQDRRQHIFSHCRWMCLSLPAAGPNISRSDKHDYWPDYHKLCCGFMFLWVPWMRITG